MKNIFLLAIAMATSCMGFSKIWRVNNTSGVAADFTTIQAAHDSAAVMPGDTIHLEPSITGYGNLINMTKRLTIISIGYYLIENPGLEYTSNTGVMGVLTINNASASGSVFHCNFSGDITISATTSLRFQRCKIVGELLINNANNNVILQSYLRWLQIDNSTNNIVSNNIISHVLRVNSSAAAIITNNVLHAEWDAGGISYPLYNSVFRNNIISRGGRLGFANTIIENNVSTNTNVLPEGNGNINNADVNAIFINPNGTTDTAFKLKISGSNPAIGAGSDGTDCGAYGGGSPFKPGLQAGIPSIYKINASSTPSGNTMNVTFSTRSNN